MFRSDWRYEIGKRFFKQFVGLAPVTRTPLVGEWFYKTFFCAEDHGRIIPIKKSIKDVENVVLPSEIVEHLVKKSSRRFIMKKCICRTAESCKKYPEDLGCIFLGEAVKSISPGLGKTASVDEALEHLEKCESAGLVHLIGRYKFDAVLLNAGPSDRLLSICNCCECCCVFRVVSRIYRPAGESLRKLEGVVVSSNDNCKGCGLCAETCFVNAISLSDNKSRVSDMCRGCGRCVRACPNNAMTLTFEESSGWFERTVKPLEQIVSAP